MKLLLALAAMLSTVVACSGPTASPTPSASPSASASPTATSSATATASASPTATPSVTVSASPSISASPSASPSSGALTEMFSDDFSNPASGWGVGEVTDPSGTFVGTIAYAGGALEFRQGAAGNSLWSRRDFPAGQPAVSVARVEGDLTFDGEGVGGLLCGGDDDWLVGVVLRHNGEWIAVEIAGTAAGGEVSVLDRGPSDAAIEDGVPFRLVVDCAVVDGELRLVVWAGDPLVPLASFTGTAGPAEFDRAATYSESIGEGFVQRVDNVVASGGSEPDAALLAELLGHIPDAYRATCGDTPVSSSEAGALVALACFLGNPGADVIEYVLFDSAASMDAAYQQRVTTYEAEPTDQSCDAGPDEDGYNIDGEPAGRIFCADQPFGIRMDWTDTRLNILTMANDFERSYADTFNDWLEAGPNL